MAQIIIDSTDPEWDYVIEAIDTYRNEDNPGRYRYDVDAATALQEIPPISAYEQEFTKEPWDEIDSVINGNKADTD
jgi:hypothetical protein